MPDNRSGGAQKGSNPNELTIDNSALVLIDHQPAVALCAPSLRQEVLVNNVAGLARSAKLLDVPTVLTTVGAQGSVLVDPIFKEISEIFPEIPPIDRTSTHAWSHPKVRAAIEATGRKKLIMAGILTEVCLAQSVLAALKEGFEVFFVSDCSAGGSVEAHEDAKARMTMAGAKPINWVAVTAEWAPDYTSPERAAVAEVWSQRGGAPAMLTDFVMAQVKAGLVSVPDSLTRLTSQLARGSARI
jgi:nicotinamidase-related amidase